MRRRFSGRCLGSGLVGLGHGIEHTQDGTLVLLRKGHQLAEAAPAAPLWRVAGVFGGGCRVGADEFVGGHAQGSGELGHDVQVGIAAAGLVIADSSLGGADGVPELCLRKTACFAQGQEPGAEDGRGCAMPWHEGEHSVIRAGVVAQLGVSIKLVN